MLSMARGMRLPHVSFSAPLCAVGPARKVFDPWLPVGFTASKGAPRGRSNLSVAKGRSSRYSAALGGWGNTELRSATHSTSPRGGAPAGAITCAFREGRILPPLRKKLDAVIRPCVCESGVHRAS